MSITMDIISVFTWAANGIAWGLGVIFGKPVDPRFGYAALVIMLLWLAYLVIKLIERYFFYFMVVLTCFFFLTLLTYLRIV